ncbi:MAG TPA: trehalose-phosphatase [Actinomycetota bacterium]|nr:trehalose-phosphatase [Actinomycetota bacterium]
MAILEEAVDGFRSEPAASGFVLDFDGTLSPIAPAPDLARAQPGAAEALGELAARFPLVALLSGRPAAQLHDLIPVPGVRYFGRYGGEEYGDGGAPAPWVAPLVEEARAFLTEGGWEGCTIEDKGQSVALHYRQAASPAAGRALGAWARARAGHLGLEVRPGRRVVELTTPGPTKAGTVERLIEVIPLRRVLVAGDDVADVASMRRAGELLGPRALRLGVASSEAPTELLDVSDVVVGSPAEVVAVLERFAGVGG